MANAGLGKASEQKRKKKRQSSGFTDGVLDYNYNSNGKSLQPDLGVFEYQAERETFADHAERDTMAGIEPADLRSEQLQVAQAHQRASDQSEPKSYFNQGAHLTLGKAPQKNHVNEAEDYSDENDRNNESD